MLFYSSYFHEVKPFVGSKTILDCDLERFSLILYQLCVAGYSEKPQNLRKEKPPARPCSARPSVRPPLLIRYAKSAESTLSGKVRLECLVNHFYCSSKRHPKISFLHLELFNSKFQFFFFF